MLRRGDLPEPPPPGWGELGPHPEYTVKRIASREEMDRECRARGISAADAWNKRRLGACVDTKAKEILLPDWDQDSEKAEAVARHEYPHSWGLRHKPSGHEWIGPDGQPAGPLTPTRAQLMRSLAEAQARQAVLRPPTQMLAQGEPAVLPVAPTR